METILCNAVDYITLVAPDVVATLLEGRFDICLALAECPIIATEELAIDGIVCHFEGE